MKLTFRFSLAPKTQKVKNGIILRIKNLIKWAAIHKRVILNSLNNLEQITRYVIFLIAHLFHFSSVFLIKCNFSNISIKVVKINLCSVLLKAKRIIRIKIWVLIDKPIKDKRLTFNPCITIILISLKTL